MKIHASANKIAEFATAKTPARRKSVVRSVKNPGKGHAPWYMAFGTPAKEFLINGGQDPAPIYAAMEALKGRTDTPWLKTDSRITADVFKAFLKAAPELDALDATFVATKKRFKAKIEIGGVEITVTPDLMVHGERKGAPLVGALRFYLAKDSTYQLGARAAELVAAMMHRWLTESATGERAPDTSLCAVLECFQQRATQAREEIDVEYAILEKACADFANLWHLLDEQDAA